MVIPNKHFVETIKSDYLPFLLFYTKEIKKSLFMILQCILILTRLDRNQIPEKNSKRGLYNSFRFFKLTTSVTERYYPTNKEKAFMPHTKTVIDYSKLFDYQSDGTIFSNPKYYRKNTIYGAALGHENSQGYRVFCLNGKKVRVHRLIWEMFNGPLPEGAQVDHKDTNRLNNRIENLRLVTQSQNQQNRKPNANRKYPKGVNFKDGSYYVAVQANKEITRKGPFKTVEEAEQAAIELRNKLHGEFARHH